MCRPEHDCCERIAINSIDTGQRKVRISSACPTSIAIPAVQLNATRAHFHGLEIAIGLGDDFHEFVNDMVECRLLKDTNLWNAEDVLRMQGEEIKAVVRMAR